MMQVLQYGLNEFSYIPVHNKYAVDGIHCMHPYS